MIAYIPYTTERITQVFAAQFKPNEIRVGRRSRKKSKWHDEDELYRHCLYLETILHFAGLGFCIESKKLCTEQVSSEETQQSSDCPSEKNNGILPRDERK